MDEVKCVMLGGIWVMLGDIWVMLGDIWVMLGDMCMGEVTYV